MERKAKAMLIGAVCLAGGLWSGHALARQVPVAEENQVRVACDLLATGRLANCAVLSRYSADEGFDAAALQAARTARVWPISPDMVQGRIHFPILFKIRSGPDLEGASPGMGLLRVRLPGEPDKPDDRRALIPAVPTGAQGRAWGGLGCVVSEAHELKTCWADNYESPTGLLAGELIYYSPIQTASGETIDLPDDLPELPDVVRRSWTPGGQVDGYDYFVREISRSGDVVLVWDAESEDEGPMSFWLTEMDCPGQRVRPLLRLIAEDGHPRYAWHPSTWFSVAEDAAGETLTPFKVVCPA